MVSWLQNQGEMSGNQIGRVFKRAYLILFWRKLDVDDICIYIDICCKILELLQTKPVRIRMSQVPNMQKKGLIG